MTWHPKIETLFWQVLSRILFVSIHCRVKSTMLNNTVIINICLILLFIYYGYYMSWKDNSLNRFSFDRKCCSKWRNHDLVIFHDRWFKKKQKKKKKSTPCSPTLYTSCCLLLIYICKTSVSFSCKQSPDAGRWSDWKDKDSSALWHAAGSVQTPGYTTDDGGWPRWF